MLSRTACPSFFAGAVLCVVLGVGSAAHAIPHIVTPEPRADGVLIDAERDGAWETSGQGGSEGLELCVGNRFGEGQAAVIEFALPAEGKSIKSATISLVPNGPHGTYPDSDPSLAPGSTLWAYWGSAADGQVDNADAPESDEAAHHARVGVFIEQDTPLASGRRFGRDVTEQVRQAANAGAQWIGFRVVPDDLPSRTGCWRWRSSEFAERHGETHAPRLEISYDD